METTQCFPKQFVLKFDKQIPMTLMIKHCLNAAEFVSVLMKKKGKPKATQNLKKKKKKIPSKPNNIDKEKLDDV